MQEGNFLALKFTATEDSTTTVYITDYAGTRSVELDSDMQLVARIADKEAQTLRIVTEKEGMASKEINLDLTGLRLL